MTPGRDSRIDSSISFVFGDTWSGINPSVQIIDTDGSPPDTDLSSVTMQFKTRENTRDVVVSLSSADAEIVIDSANTWTFHIPAQNLPSLLPGTYYWCIQCTDVSGNKQTWLDGHMMVLPQGVIS